jgi:hypothetical protein
MENPYSAPHQTNSIDDKSSDVALGKLLVIAVIAFVIVMSLTVIVMNNVVKGHAKLPTQAVRLGLEVLLVVCLYNGYSWARYVMVVLFGLGGIFGLAVLSMMGAEGGFLGKAILGVLGIGYMACAIILAAVPSVGQFMESQRQKRGAM